MIRPDQQACKCPIRFCQEPISMVADIEGMFHQVQVAPKDCQALRFLWWPNSVFFVDGWLLKVPCPLQRRQYEFPASWGNFSLEEDFA